MSEKPKQARLNDFQRLRVFALIARGDSNQAIVDEIQARFGIKVTMGAISSMKKAHADSIAVMKQAVAKAEIADAEALLTRSHRLLGKKLTKAERDESELEELYSHYRAGRITWKELQQKKAGLLRISVAELNAVSREMYVQTGKGDSPPRQPIDATIAQTDALMSAIKAGDTVELQRIIFRANNDKSIPV